jgi:metallophosphoesterase superfamily enzyme
MDWCSCQRSRWRTTSDISPFFILTREGDEMIAVISDVHLGYEKCNRESFIDFVNVFLGEEHIDHVVLLGDILDFWRRSAKNVVEENRDIPVNML